MTTGNVVNIRVEVVLNFSGTTSVLGTGRYVSISSSDSTSVLVSASQTREYSIILLEVVCAVVEKLCIGTESIRIINCYTGHGRVSSESRGEERSQIGGIGINVGVAALGK